MVSKWKEISLADAVEFIVDNRGKSVPVQDEGFPLIATNCISNDNLYPEFINVRYISDETHKNWFRSHPLPGDIILTNKGSKNGAICLVPDPVSFCIAQDMVALRAKKELVYPKYLFAALRSSLVQKRMKDLNVDSVIPHFKKTDFNKLLFPLPAYDKQVFIGDCYYNYCNRIELNRQTNQTLEAMAQALFKSWFVDFDPVIDNALAAGHEIPPELQARAEARKSLQARAEQRQASLSGDRSEQESGDILPESIRQLFPNRFVLDAQMGWIPEGWEVKSLDQLAYYQNGLALQKFRPEDENNYLPVVKIAQLKKGYADGEEKASPNINPSCVLNNGDVVFSWSGSLMVDVWCGGKAALNQHLFKVTSEEYPKWFYLWYTKHHLVEFQRIASDKAVTMGHIKRSHLSEAKCVVPPSNIMNCEDNPIPRLLDKEISIRLQTNDLTKLRDTLLPKLISGELRLPDEQQPAKTVTA